MVKLETIEKSLRKALDEFLSISDKNFTSVAIPFLGKNDENVEKTAKEMIDVIVNFFEKHKKLTTRIQDLTICVKEKEEFLSLEKFFWQRIQDYIDRNMIWSE